MSAKHRAGSRSGPGSERLFLAVDLSDECRGAVAAMLRDIQLPGRPVPPSNWHITLRFLGDTAPEARDVLIPELEGADLGDPFDLTLSGAGAFPGLSRASVLWIGTGEGTPRLETLAGEVEDAVRRAGIAPDPKPFHPHLTIARLRIPADARRYLDALAAIDVRLPVYEVVLFRSALGAGAPRYERIAAIPLRSL
jgi:RNA 2',3'-cyclic 3'-phosphodiesterase